MRSTTYFLLVLLVFSFGACTKTVKVSTSEDTRVEQHLPQTEDVPVESKDTLSSKEALLELHKFFEHTCPTSERYQIVHGYRAHQDLQAQKLFFLTAAKRLSATEVRSGDLASMIAREKELAEELRIGADVLNLIHHEARYAVGDDYTFALRELEQELSMLQSAKAQFHQLLLAKVNPEDSEQLSEPHIPNAPRTTEAIGMNFSNIQAQRQELQRMIRETQRSRIRGMLAEQHSLTEGARAYLLELRRGLRAQGVDLSGVLQSHGTSLANMLAKAEAQASYASRSQRERAQRVLQEHREQFMALAMQQQKIKAEAREAAIAEVIRQGTVTRADVEKLLVDAKASDDKGAAGATSQLSSLGGGGGGEEGSEAELLKLAMMLLAA